MVNSLEKIIVDRVIEALRVTTSNNDAEFPVEASGRHVHLSVEHLHKLFGNGYELTPVKELSQPGQYACKERVRIIGSKGEFPAVVVLGPCRNQTQVELSLTDCSLVGVKGVIRESGQIKGSSGILLGVGNNFVQLNEGVIVARRHLHMTVKDSERLKVEDGQIVMVRVNGKRPLIFDDVVVRVNDEYRLAMHIDYDEANACGYESGMMGSIYGRDI